MLMLILLSILNKNIKIKYILKIFGIKYKYILKELKK